MLQQTVSTPASSDSGGVTIMLYPHCQEPRQEEFRSLFFWSKIRVNPTTYGEQTRINKKHADFFQELENFQILGVYCYGLRVVPDSGKGVSHCHNVARLIVVQLQLCCDCPRWSMEYTRKAPRMLFRQFQR